MIRTAETHPLTWRLRDDNQPVWLDSIVVKTDTKVLSALKGMAPDEVVNLVKAGLKRRCGLLNRSEMEPDAKDENMKLRCLYVMRMKWNRAPIKTVY